MRVEQQTEELKVRMYDLTLQFVRKYQRQYYKQYKGDLEDLVMDFYCNFLTPKSRTLGNEESLLDKFDPTHSGGCTSLERVVKVSVVRMLIDRSRSNPYQVESIDRFVDDFGDFMTTVFGLTTDDQEEEDLIETRVFGKDFITTASSRFDSLAEKAKNTIIKQYLEVKAVLAPNYQQLFEAVIKIQEVEVIVPENVTVKVAIDGVVLDAPVQQITPKTICCLVEGSIKEFNRITGEARGKAYKGLQVIEDSLNEILAKDVFHSGMDRNEFLTAHS